MASRGVHRTLFTSFAYELMYVLLKYTDFFD